jgi:hypothetical protein
MSGYAGGKPEIAVGDRFAITSVRGSEYKVLLLCFGDGQSGMYVRLDDGRIARLDQDRLRWETFHDLPREGEPVLRPGDEVLIECASGSLRGTLVEPPGEQVALHLPIGQDLRLPRGEIDELYLLFKARDLRPGDRIILRSKSGNEYRGTLKGLTADRRLLVDLRNGGEANLRLSKLDLTSIQVPIPIALESLA